MVSYSDDGRYAYFNGWKFLKDRKTGYYLETAKNNGHRRRRLHVAVWEYFNGPVPKGMHVHHVDKNKGNNEIDNLALLDGREHVTYHSRSQTDEQLERKRKNIIEKAVPAAKGWHKSEEGRKWHSEHAKREAEALVPVEYTCTQCGKKFFTKNRYAEDANRFCSNNCRAAFRRKSGVDNETRICECCNKPFTINKYTRTRTCSRSCASQIRSDRRR